MMKNNKKVDDSTNSELYEHFKEGMIDLVKHQYESNANNPGTIEPMVFVGVRRRSLEKLAKENPGLLEQVTSVNDRLENNPELKDVVSNYGINCVGIPCGIFFEDTGTESLNDMKKLMGVAMIKSAIHKLGEDNLSDVMFCVFISEAFVLSPNLTDDQKKLVKQGLDPFPNGIPRPSTSKDSTEAVMLSFETRFQSQLVTIPVKRLGDFVELGNVNEHPLSSEPAQGIMTGLLQSKDSPGMN